MIIYTILALLIIALSVCLYLIRVLIIKNKKLEIIVNDNFLFFTGLVNQLNQSFQKLREVDRLGAFKSDDEVGIIFTTISKVVDDIIQFLKNKNVLYSSNEVIEKINENETTA